MTGPGTEPSATRRHLGRTHLIAGVLLVAAVSAGTAAATVDSSNSGNQSVVLVNQQDGRVLDRVGFSLKRELDDTVDNKNGAAAVSAGCDGCRTVAVAVQVVL